MIKVKLDLYYVKTNSYTKFQVKRQERKVRKTEFLQRAITEVKVGQM